MTKQEGRIGSIFIVLIVLNILAFDHFVYFCLGACLSFQPNGMMVLAARSVCSRRHAWCVTENNDVCVFVVFLPCTEKS